jgi:pyrroloquinoline quinone (PQQ) biosynthesis protein C
LSGKRDRGESECNDRGVIPLSHPTVERLLAIMDQKNHWAWSTFTRPGLSRAQLLVHFRHEYATYVRDFPVLLARALGQVPDLIDVRRSLAENIYEEQTGGLSRSAPHPELFLRMMEGLGFARASFVEAALQADLHPAARSYHDWLVERSAAAPWQAATALLTIFVEGSVNERAELTGIHVRAKGDAAVLRHPLVVHYGCPPEAMHLVRAHGDVEGGHRGDAWRIVLDHAKDEAVTRQVIDTCMDGLARWHRYRDGVADLMGLLRDQSTAPPPVAQLSAR